MASNGLSQVDEITTAASTLGFERGSLQLLRAADEQFYETHGNGGLTAVEQYPAYLEAVKNRLPHGEQRKLLHNYVWAFIATIRMGKEPVSGMRRKPIVGEGTVASDLSFRPASASA